MQNPMSQSSSPLLKGFQARYTQELDSEEFENKHFSIQMKWMPSSISSMTIETIQMTLGDTVAAESHLPSS